jgi:hypothetical protein
MLPRTYLPSNDYYMYTREYEPALAVDGNGVVHVTWTHYVYYYNYTTFPYPSPNPQRYTVIAIRYVNNSGGWGTPVDLYLHNSTSPRYQYRPSIAVDSANNVHIVAYGRTPTNNNENLYYYKLDAITGWAPSVNITPLTSQYNREPCIATDVDDNIHVAFHTYDSSNSAYEINYIKWDAATETWGSVEQITTPIYQVSSCFNPSIGIDQRGYVYIAFRDQHYVMGSVSDSVMFTVNDGTGWSSPHEITTDGRFKGVGNYQYYASILGHGPHCYPITGMALVWTPTMQNMFDPDSQRYEVTFYSTDDFFTGFGPLKGIPPITHFYRDDIPSGTEEDMYDLTLRVIDDDTAIGEYVIPVRVKNFWPELDKTELALELVGNENALYTPELEFTDMGTGLKT